MLSLQLINLHQSNVGIENAHASLTEHLSSLRSSEVARARVAQIWPSQFPAL